MATVTKSFKTGKAGLTNLTTSAVEYTLYDRKGGFDIFTLSPGSAIELLNYFKVSFDDDEIGFSDLPLVSKSFFFSKLANWSSGWIQNQLGGAGVGDWLDVILTDDGLAGGNAYFVPDFASVVSSLKQLLIFVEISTTDPTVSEDNVTRVILNSSTVAQGYYWDVANGRLEVHLSDGVSYTFLNPGMGFAGVTNEAYYYRVVVVKLF